MSSCLILGRTISCCRVIKLLMPGLLRQTTSYKEHQGSPQSWGPAAHPVPPPRTALTGLSQLLQLLQGCAEGGGTRGESAGLPGAGTGLSETVPGRLCRESLPPVPQQGPRPGQLSAASQHCKGSGPPVPTMPRAAIPCLQPGRVTVTQLDQPSPGPQGCWGERSLPGGSLPLCQPQDLCKPLLGPSSPEREWYRC